MTEQMARYSFECPRCGEEWSIDRLPLLPIHGRWNLDRLKRDCPKCKWKRVEACALEM